MSIEHHGELSGRDYLVIVMPNGDATFAMPSGVEPMDLVGRMGR